MAGLVAVEYDRRDHQCGILWRPPGVCVLVSDRRRLVPVAGMLVLMVDHHAMASPLPLAWPYWLCGAGPATFPGRPARGVWHSVAVGAGSAARWLGGPQRRKCN